MIFSLAVYSAPHSHQASHSAYHFAHSALEARHRIYRVFFHHDGVYNGCPGVCSGEEIDIPARWAELAREHDIDLVVCSATALRRGVLDQQEARRYQRPGATLHPQFTLSGLGQLIDALQYSDRLLNFGS